MVMGKLGIEFGELVKEGCGGEVRIVWGGRCVGLGRGG